MRTNIRFVRLAAGSFGLALLAPTAHAQLYGTSPFQNQLWKLDMGSLDW